MCILCERYGEVTMLLRRPRRLGAAVLFVLPDDKCWKELDAGGGFLHSK